MIYYSFAVAVPQADLRRLRHQESRKNDHKKQILLVASLFMFAFVDYMLYAWEPTC